MTEQVALTTTQAPDVIPPQGKCPRVDDETPSIPTIMFNGDENPVNTAFNTDSNVTVISRDTYCDDEVRLNTIRLERLCNKEDRYESHISFLKDCSNIKHIPKRLVIDLEPSIGNNDEEFCAKWYQRLEEFSLILMNNIIKYSEKVKQETSERANSELDKFQTNMTAEDYKEVCDTLHQNSTERKQTLLLAKRKKFNSNITGVHRCKNTTSVTMTNGNRMAEQELKETTTRTTEILKTQDGEPITTR